MKNIITLIFLIIISIVVFSSCEKDTVPPYPSLNMFSDVETTHCYIATEMKASNHLRGNYFIEVDTVNYSNLMIALSFSGNLVSQDIQHLSNPNEFIAPYYINVIKGIEVFANKKYVNNNNCVTHIFKYIHNTDVIDSANLLIGLEFGFPYLSLALINTPPDVSGFYSFTIEIIDIYDNTFIATTDSVFIIK